MDRVIHRTGRTGEMKHVVYLAAIKRLVDIDFAQFKPGIVPQMVHVGFTAGQEIVNGDDGISFTQEGIAQVRSQKTRASSD